MVTFEQPGAPAGPANGSNVAQALTKLPLVDSFLFCRSWTLLFPAPDLEPVSNLGIVRLPRSSAALSFLHLRRLASRCSCIFSFLKLMTHLLAWHVSPGDLPTDLSPLRGGRHIYDLSSSATARGVRVLRDDLAQRHHGLHLRHPRLHSATVGREERGRPLYLVPLPLTSSPFSSQ